MLIAEGKIMLDEEDYQPVTRITLTYGATWQIAFAVIMGNLLTGIIIGAAYALFRK
jgi:hypothetical protein